MSIPLRPVRVMVTKEGCALPPRMAEKRYGVKADIVFYRADGWSLGSPAELEEAAYQVWRDSWIVFQRAGEEMKSIEQYEPKKGTTT